MACIIVISMLITFINSEWIQETEDFFFFAENVKQNYFH